MNVKNLERKQLHKSEQEQIEVDMFIKTTYDFLRCIAHESILDKEFTEIIGKQDVKKQMQSLLKAAGYKNNPKGFFLHFLEEVNAQKKKEKYDLRINGVRIPYFLALEYMKKIIPDEKLYTITSVEQLEDVTKTQVPANERIQIQQVLETYPVRFSSHTIRQMMLSRHVAYQYMPFIQELDTTGLHNTWVGQHHEGLLERMYKNRVIFVLNMECPVYCRFCFRKHKECRQQSQPTIKDIDKAVAYLSKEKDVKEVVLTGGDPFMNRATLKRAIDGLKNISHIKTLRLATRSVSYYPQLFTLNENAYMDYLKETSIELKRIGKVLELATHFIHPDEVSTEALYVISELVENGIPIYIQTPFLKDCNESGKELTKLYSMLRGAGAEIHYVYIPCSPIQGNSIYWTTISSGHKMQRYLRAHVSDRAIPKICTATSIGKIDWHTSGWAVEQADNDHIWIRTPYTKDYINSFANFELSEKWRENEEGTIDAKFMTKIGEKNLLYGARKKRNISPQKTDMKKLRQAQEIAYQDQCTHLTLVPTHVKGVYRPHKTRIEIDVSKTDIHLAMTYVQQQIDVTDVILSGKDDVIDSLDRIEYIIQLLYTIPHINAIRIRSLKLAYEPEVFSDNLIERMIHFNKLSVEPQKDRN